MNASPLQELARFLTTVRRARDWFLADPNRWIQNRFFRGLDNIKDEPLGACLMGSFQYFGRHSASLPPENTFFSDTVINTMVGTLPRRTGDFLGYRETVWDSVEDFNDNHRTSFTDVIAYLNDLESELVTLLEQNLSQEIACPTNSSPSEPRSSASPSPSSVPLPQTAPSALAVAATT